MPSCSNRWCKLLHFCMCDRGEEDCIEKIKHTLYLPCTWHGDRGIEKQGQSNDWFVVCAQAWMKVRYSGNQNTRSPPKYNQKYHTACTQKLQDFIKNDGTYHSYLQDYHLHSFHCKFLGTHGTLKRYPEHVSPNPETHILTNRDHSERYKPSPDKEFQSEHFGKHQSLSMEGCTTTVFSPKKRRRSLYFTCIYSMIPNQVQGQFHETCIWCSLTCAKEISSNCNSSKHSLALLTVVLFNIEVELYAMSCVT